MLPGQILRELIENARVIGGIDPASAEAGRDLYAIFVRGEIILTDATTAEMVKLMENTYRDVNIAIANEFSRLADRFGVDVWEAIALANRHPRVQHPQPRAGRGRALHQRGPLVPGGGRPRPDPADPHRPQGQRRPAAFRGRPGAPRPGAGRQLAGKTHRRAGAVLQAGCGRPARKPGHRDLSTCCSRPARRSSPTSPTSRMSQVPGVQHRRRR